MNNIKLYRSRADRFGQILAHAGGRWDAPTPCEDWTVADVVSHVITTERDFLARHELASGDAPTGDPLRAWRAHATDTLAAIEADGVADTAFDGYFGHTTIGATLADFYGWDLVIHGWDVARATGQLDPITDDEAVGLDVASEAWGPALYSEGICGPAVPVAEDAGARDRLLGKLGRDPGWTPPAG